MKKIKKIGISIIFLIVLGVVISKADTVLERKYSYAKYADFYEQEQDFDVLFFGTSHMLNAVFPMELWNDYGIVSYNMANYSETICTNYWQVVSALEHCTPKVVVVDLYAIDNDSKMNGSSLHNFTDTMPSTITKIRTAMDLLPVEEWPEYMFELSLYHGRWSELTADDFAPEKTIEKGAELRFEVVVDEEPTIIPKETIVNQERLSKKYLQKIIDLCKKKDIDVILTYFPYSAPVSHQEVANSGFIIAEENDIPYMNFFYEDMKLNYVTDCADIGSHLNASGARKVTDYLGQYLRTNYEIPDRRTEEAYAFWNEDYQEYMNFKIEELNSCDDNILTYLMLLNDSSLETKLYLTEDSLIYQDKVIMELVENIGTLGQITYEFLPDNYYEGNIMLEVRDKKTQEIVSTMNYSRVEENVYDAY